MDKEHLKYFWRLIIVSFLGISCIIALFFRMKNAEVLVNEYTQAKTCPLIANCRRVIDAKILESKESWVFIPNNRGRGYSGGSVSAKYMFSIFTAESKNETVTVVPDVPSNTKNFDIQGVYIPNSSYKYFVRDNFFDGAPIEVETWRNAITFLFFDSIIYPPNDPFAPPTAMPAQKAEPSVSPDPHPKYQIAIPTTNNPVVIAEFARRDFGSWGSLVGFVTSCAVLVLFFRITRKSRNSERKHAIIH